MPLYRIFVDFESKILNNFSNGFQGSLKKRFSLNFLYYLNTNKSLKKKVGRGTFNMLFKIDCDIDVF